MDENTAAIDAAEQVAYLKLAKGVTFNLVDEARAATFLEDKSYFFKLKAFAKNYDKRVSQECLKGAYVGLDFGHLVELSKLGKAVRDLTLGLTLDIEHYLKTRVNRAAMDAHCDRYGLAEDYLAIARSNVLADQLRNYDEDEAARAIRDLAAIADAIQVAEGPDAIVALANDAAACIAHITLGRSPDFIRESFATMKSSPYSKRLVEKYADERFPYWCLLELMSLGPSIALYKACFREGGLIDDERERATLKDVNNLLRHVQVLRNSAAHGDCLLHELSRYSRDSSMGKIRQRLLAYGPDREVVAQVQKVRIAMDLAAVLMCYDVIVPPGGTRIEAAEMLRAARARLIEHADWFAKNYSVSSFIAYVDEILSIFSDRFEGDRQ